MKTYFGIGSRSLSQVQRDFCFDVGAWMSKEGWILSTGACKGADQAFAEGALSIGGKVILCLPWPNYEAGWICTLNPELVEIVILNYQHKEAFESVDLYHPAAKNLTRGARSLHARNFLILERSVFGIAWPSQKKGGGGTGQGLRIAEATGKKVFNLSKESDYQKVARRIYEPRAV